MTCYNFAAGPAMLPVEVIAQIKQDLPDYAHSGMSVMEISHRSALYKELYAETKANLLELMKLDQAEYDVLFLTGGATQQFTTIPLNLARKYHRIAVVDSGHWAQRAAEDAAKVPGLTVTSSLAPRTTITLLFRKSRLNLIKTTTTSTSRPTTLLWGRPTETTKFLRPTSLW